MLRLIVFLPFIFSCSAKFNPSYELENWKNRKLPLGTCEHENPILVVNDYGCPTISSDACFQYDGSQPTVWISKARLDKDSAYVFHHELMHWLAICSGLEPDGDPDHSNILLWGKFN